MGPGTGAGGAGQQGSERAVEQRRGGLGGEEGADEGARVSAGQRLSGRRGAGEKIWAALLSPKGCMSRARRTQHPSPEESGDTNSAHYIN